MTSTTSELLFGSTTLVSCDWKSRSLLSFILTAWPSSGFGLSLRPIQSSQTSTSPHGKALLLFQMHMCRMRATPATTSRSYNALQTTLTLHLESTVKHSSGVRRGTPRSDARSKASSFFWSPGQLHFFLRVVDHALVFRSDRLYLNPPVFTVHLNSSLSNFPFIQ
jgi:hypothetical protein